MTCRVQHRRPVHTLSRTLHRACVAHAPTWMEAASGITSARCPCVVHWDARLTAADGAQPTRSHPRASTAELGPRACGSPRPRISHSPRQPLCGDDHLGKPCECHPPPSPLPPFTPAGTATTRTHLSRGSPRHSTSRPQVRAARPSSSLAPPHSLPAPKPARHRKDYQPSYHQSLRTSMSDKTCTTI